MSDALLPTGGNRDTNTSISSAHDQSVLTNTTDLNVTDPNLSSSSPSKTPSTRTPSPSLEHQINDALRLNRISKDPEEEEGATALVLPPQPASSSSNSSSTSNPGLNLIESNYS